MPRECSFLTTDCLPARMIGTYQLQISTVACALSPRRTCQPASRAWLYVTHLGSSNPHRADAAARESLLTPLYRAPVAAFLADQH